MADLLSILCIPLSKLRAIPRLGEHKVRSRISRLCLSSLSGNLSSTLRDNIILPYSVTTSLWLTLRTPLSIVNSRVYVLYVYSPVTHTSLSPVHVCVVFIQIIILYECMYTLCDSFVCPSTPIWVLGFPERYTQNLGNWAFPFPYKTWLRVEIAIRYLSSRLSLAHQCVQCVWVFGICDTLTIGLLEQFLTIRSDH